MRDITIAVFLLFVGGFGGYFLGANHTKADLQKAAAAAGQGKYVVNEMDGSVRFAWITGTVVYTNSGITNIVEREK